MREVVISVDIYCHWVTTPFAYRLYIDDDLLTERTYIWNNTEQAVREHIIVNLDQGVHTLKVEPVDSNVQRFIKRNVTIDRRPILLTNDQFTVH